MVDNIIKTEEELRQIYPQPSKLASGKLLSALDSHCRDFIAASPFLVLASSNAQGYTDASPRGDSPGFVKVVDDKHLLMADWPGNNRLDSMCNILKHPKIGMLFLIPGIGETLRLNGEAQITTSEELLQRVANEKGKPPRTALLIEVQEIFLHCAKAMMRSKVWQPDTWLQERAIAYAGTIWADHMKDGTDGDALNCELNESLPKNLY